MNSNSIFHNTDDAFTKHLNRHRSRSRESCNQSIKRTRAILGRRNQSLTTEIFQKNNSSLYAEQCIFFAYYLLSKLIIDFKTLLQSADNLLRFMNWNRKVFLMTLSIDDVAKCQNGNHHEQKLSFGISDERLRQSWDKISQILSIFIEKAVSFVKKHRQNSTHLESGDIDDFVVCLYTVLYDILFLNDELENRNKKINSVLPIHSVPETLMQLIGTFKCEILLTGKKLREISLILKNNTDKETLK